MNKVKHAQNKVLPVEKMEARKVRCQDLLSNAQVIQQQHNARL